MVPTTKERRSTSLLLLLLTAATSVPAVSCLGSSEPVPSTTNKFNEKKSVGSSSTSLPHHAAVVDLAEQQEEKRYLEEAAPSPNANNEEQQQHKAPFYKPKPKMAPLYQNNFGNYYMDLYIGTPPQRQTVTIDTEGILTALPCHESRHEEDGGGNGAHADLYYNESASRTFVSYGCDDACVGTCVREPGGAMEEKCMVNMSYGTSGYYTAYQVRDRAYPGGPHDSILYPPLFWDEGMSGVLPAHSSAFTFRLVYGCQVADKYGTKGLFDLSLANGVAGFGPSNWALWNQMRWDDVVPDVGFSLCFPSQNQKDDASLRNNTKAVGAVTIGGTDERLHSTPMLYAKDLRSDGRYTVQLNKVYLRRHGGESVKPDSDRMDEVLFELRGVDPADLNVHGGVAIATMDIGFYMQNALEGPFREEWMKIVGWEYTNDPVVLSEEEVLELPTILFQLRSADKQIVDVSDPFVVTGLAGQLGDQDLAHDIVVAIPPQHYMMKKSDDEDGNTYHSMFYFFKDDSQRAILGANFLMGHDVHFDVNNNAIGFSESACNYDAVLQDEINTLEEKGINTGDSARSNTIVEEEGWNKCGGWCIFGKINLGVFSVLGCIWCYRVYKQYESKKEEYEEEVINMSSGRGVC